MRHVCALVFCIFVSGLASAQESRADLFAGYSYVNIDTNDISSRQSANGWEVAVSGNFNKWFAVEGDVSGYYKSYNVDLTALNLGAVSAKVTDYSFAGGPRINLKPIFIHALFGGDHLGASVPGFSTSQDGMAGLAGGGVQWKVSGPWSVRASVDYVFTRHNIFGGPSFTQNNYRASAGIVYSFGMRHTTEQVASNQTPDAGPENPRTVPAGLKIPSLGVFVTLGRSQGALITDAAPNGLAQLGGIHIGDVINTVDGKAVKSPTELEAELAGKAAGDKVRLGFLIHGQWQTETVILWPK
jgi:hypothetical protein